MSRWLFGGVSKVCFWSLSDLLLVAGFSPVFRWYLSGILLDSCWFFAGFWLVSLDLVGLSLVSRSPLAGLSLCLASTLSCFAEVY